MSSVLETGTYPLPPPMLTFSSSATEKGNLHARIMELRREIGREAGPREKRIGERVDGRETCERAEEVSRGEGPDGGVRRLARDVGGLEML